MAVTLSNSQNCDCPYPIIFLHGYTGSASTFDGSYNDSNFQGIWGGQTDIFHAVLNANTGTNIWGDDGVAGTTDDDVLVFFNNESNTLAPGCVYSMNFQNYWNEDESNPQIIINGCGSPSLLDNDSNESAIYKQGYALGKMIESVLAANPSADKVIVVGHSMGGLETREYLQRTNSSGNPMWWVNPNQADGHQILKMITTSTPHRGSNFFGNPWPTIKNEDGELTHGDRDGLPDISSEATRDLRWSYAFNPVDPAQCGWFQSCPGPYLWGGDEDNPWGYWNHDVNCDGDEDDTNIVGINEAGSSNAWDGTKDNPSMPLPHNLRYTWITSDVGTSGDLVVDLDRQWIYSGSTPEPSDGVAHRMTDTLLTDVDHLAVDDDVNVVVRALDEGDYPAFAWDLNLDNANEYVGVTQLRSVNVPDGPNSTDPDWFRFFIPAGTLDDICINLTPHPALSGQIDYFQSPANYADMSTTGDVSMTFASGGTAVTINLVSGSYVAGAYNYFRVIHTGVGMTSWHTPYKIQPITKPALPVVLSELKATSTEKHIDVSWVTLSETNNEYFEILKSTNLEDWTSIGTVNSLGDSQSKVNYNVIDRHPAEGMNYYKLKQVDYDGSFVISHAVQCRFTKRIDPSITTYPNPFQDELLIQLNHLEDDFELEMYDAIGQRVFYKSYTHDQEEYMSILLESNDLNTGMYFIRVKTKDGFQLSSQIIKN